jgi:hypothetical protein
MNHPIHTRCLSLRPTHIVAQIKRLSIDHWLRAYKQSPQCCNPNLAGHGYYNCPSEGHITENMRASMATSTYLAQTARMMTSIAYRSNSHNSGSLTEIRANHILTTNQIHDPVFLCSYPLSRISHQEGGSVFLLDKKRKQCTTNTTHIPNNHSFSFVTDRMASFALLHGKQTMDLQRWDDWDMAFKG